jgi:hypothetical protein
MPIRAFIGDADFVADGGEEGALGAVGVIGLLLGQAQVLDQVGRSLMSIQPPMMPCTSPSESR